MPEVKRTGCITFLSTVYKVTLEIELFIWSHMMPSCVFFSSWFLFQTKTLTNLSPLSLFQVSNKGEMSIQSSQYVCRALSVWYAYAKKGLLCLLSRGLLQTTCLRHQPQLNLQMLFPHCNLLLGRVLLRLLLLLLSQLRSEFLFVLNSLWFPFCPLALCALIIDRHRLLVFTSSRCTKTNQNMMNFGNGGVDTPACST